MSEPAQENPGLLRVFIKLMKLRVIVLLQVTAICAILVHDLLARYGSIDADRTWMDTIYSSVITLVGGTLSAGGSNAINMWYDADIDPGMNRTKNRPVPMGWISKEGALLFGLTIAILGSSLFFLIHWKAAFWSFFSVAFYVLIYTILLKRRTPQNIVIGGAAGATPPVIGWATAASEEALSSANPFDLGSALPWMLFFLIFLWTPPHFWALALYRSGEYGKVGIPMMPDVKGAKRTVTESKVYCVLLFGLGAVPCVWPGSGLPLLWSFVAGLLTLWYSATVWRIDPEEPFDENGRMPKAAKSFFASLKYLGFMFLALVAISAIPPEILGFLGPL